MPTQILDIVDTAVKIGLGALISGIATYHVTKLSQKSAAQKEREKWNRKEKHRAYSKLARCIMAFSLDENKLRTPFQDFAILSESILLTEDEELIEALDIFLHKLEKMRRLGDSNNPEDRKVSGQIYKEIYPERLSLVKKLRDDLKKATP